MSDEDRSSSFEDQPTETLGGVGDGLMEDAELQATGSIYEDDALGISADSWQQTLACCCDPGEAVVPIETADPAPAPGTEPETLVWMDPATGQGTRSLVSTRTVMARSIS